MVQAVAVFKLAHDVARPSPVPVFQAAANATKLERRGPDRAKNVVRPQAKTKALARTATSTSASPTQTDTENWKAF